MSDKIIVCTQDRLGNSILTVHAEGRVIGHVLEDRPGEWVIVREPIAKPRYPTLEAVVAALIEQKRVE